MSMHMQAVGRSVGGQMCRYAGERSEMDRMGMEMGIGMWGCGDVRQTVNATAVTKRRITTKYQQLPTEYSLRMPGDDAMNAVCSTLALPSQCPHTTATVLHFPLPTPPPPLLLSFLLWLHSFCSCSSFFCLLFFLHFLACMLVGVDDSKRSNNKAAKYSGPEWPPARQIDK